MGRALVLKSWSALAQCCSAVKDACTLGLAPHQVRGRRGQQLGEVPPGGRMAIAALALSAAGIVGIMTREGYVGQAYPDPVHGTAVATIGFGSTQGVKMGDKIDPVSAVNRTLREVQFKEDRIRQCAAGVQLHQHEYDAYVELAHNIGESAFCRSSIVKALRSQQHAKACDHILDWKYVTVAGPLGPTSIDCSKPNKTCGGLWADRQRLHKKCTGAA